MTEAAVALSPDTLTPDEARGLTDQIRAKLEAIAPLIERAVLGRAWEALGYETWSDYVVGEFGGPLRLGREERQEAVLRLRQGGLTTRAIGEALGVDHKTVVNDYTAGGEYSPPERVVGLDGKSYPAQREPSGLGRLAPLMTSDSPEWYTPQHVLAAVERALGGIDLDPCSNSKTEPNVAAANHYTEEDDGLAQPWFGRVYMNPPYGREIGDWTRKLVEEYEGGRVTEAIALVPARVETEWFRAAEGAASRWSVPAGRLSFSESENSAPFPSAVLYLGPNTERFTEVFAALGRVYQRVA